LPKKSDECEKRSGYEISCEKAFEDVYCGGLFYYAYLSMFNRKMLHVKKPKNIYSLLYIVISNRLRT
jgi:hypothetical protein